VKEVRYHCANRPEKEYRLVFRTGYPYPVINIGLFIVQ